MATGKHFINNVDGVVLQGLRSLLSQNGSLRLIEAHRVIYRQPSNSQDPKVILVSGGGSGHEPAHAGYIGNGMLDVCVAGDVFASPSASQILAGIKACKSPKGVLIIAKNYTGDKLNFGLAAQKAQALGIRVNAVFVGDDVSVESNDLVGRRGLAGVVFVHKIAGALAESGASLEQVTTMAQRIAGSLVTVGVSLDRCSVPQRPKQDSLPADSLEYGMGIHNEPGVQRAKIGSLSETIATLQRLLEPHLHAVKRAAIMVNNLGGLSVLELNVIAQHVRESLKGYGISRMLVGTFVTSLNAPGFLVTVLPLDDEIETLLNRPTNAPAWQNFVAAASPGQQIVEVEPTAVNARISGVTIEQTVVRKIIDSIYEAVGVDEPLITRYDTIAGDGDCGETLLNGVKAVRSALQNPASDLSSVFSQVATAVERSMGGTSGAIYSIFLSAVANALASATECSAVELAKALSQGVQELCRFTSARKNHRTLMDALLPFTETFAETLDFDQSFLAAKAGSDQTRHLPALLGRASYVGKEVWEKEGGIPDPGALGVVSILRGIQNSLGSA
ncbi:hypothetical protein TWF281_005145 [Arthrobotrys megalospora]